MSFASYRGMPKTMSLARCLHLSYFLQTRRKGNFHLPSADGDRLLRGTGYPSGLLVDLHAVLRSSFLVHCHPAEPQQHSIRKFGCCKCAAHLVLALDMCLMLWPARIYIDHDVMHGATFPVYEWQRFLTHPFLGCIFRFFITQALLAIIFPFSH